MFKTNVGHSIATDSFTSGVESATKAGNGLNAKLGLLFSSVALDTNEVVRGARSIMGDVPVVGCTSSGAIIVPEGIIANESGFSGMMMFDSENLVVGVAGSPRDEDPREIGKRLAREAISNAGVKKIPTYFYMVASPKEEELYLKGIQDVIGRVPFFGGSAADNAIAGDWKIFCNDKVFSDGCAVAFFFDNNEVANVYTGAYEETENVGIITKIDGRKLVEIDHVPALQKYAEWTGKTVDELKGGALLVESILAPLGVKDPLGDLIAIRHPMNGNDDLSMNIGNNLAVNTAVIQMRGTVDGLIKSTSDTLNQVNAVMKKEAAGYFLVHCGGRKVGIGDRMEEVYHEIKNAAGDKPFITIFTFGEYGSNNHSMNTCGGLMLSFTGFSK